MWLLEMPKSVEAIEAVVSYSQPPATLPEIVPLPVLTGPVSPTGEIMFNPTPPVITTRATQVHLRLHNTEHYYRPSRGRGRSRGLSRGHSSRRCGVCEECRNTQGSFVRSRCRGWIVGQPGRPNMVDTKLLLTISNTIV